MTLSYSLHPKETSGIFSDSLRPMAFTIFLNSLRLSKCFRQSGAKPDQHLQGQALWESVSPKFHGCRLWLKEVKAAFLFFLTVVWLRFWSTTQDSELVG